MKYVLSLLSLLISFNSLAQVEDDSRYTYRLPDWLWKSEKLSPFFSKELKNQLDSNFKLMDAYYKAKNGVSGDSIYDKYTAILNKQVSLSNASRGAIILGSKHKIALQLDPNYDPKFQPILIRAAQIFADIATDENVIAEAFDNSTDYPKPLPEKFDSLNNYTSAFIFFSKCRVKPSSKDQFHTQLTNVFSNISGDPALLIITAYQEIIWWGYSYYNYYYFPDIRLSRFSPSEGYLHIGLNSNKFPEYKDTAFWVSKIAHEVLHNLGYWHPTYKNAQDRDQRNIGNEKAFIVAYELAILKRAKAYLQKNK